MKRPVTLYIMFVLMLTVLFLPGLQNLFNIFSITPLEGAFISSEKPAFYFSDFEKGEYQQKTEKYIEERIGFRPLLVRLRNQIDFLLYKKANGEGIIIGKNNVIIEEDYILEYLGRLFIGENTIDKKLERVKFIQDTLTAKGIRFAIVFEPGKASFYSELIPKRYKPENKTISNYDYFIRKCNELNINYLDLNHYFCEIKSSSPYPLYPQYGTHWSNYGMTIAADTLLKYIETLLDKNLNHFNINQIDISTDLRDTDFDGGKSMNLLWKPKTWKMAYPVMEFEKHEHNYYPKVLVVADSYYWNIYNSGIPQNIFANEAFWYYNSLVYPDHYGNELKVEEIDVKSAVEQQEIILVMITERFLYTAFWSFTDNLYSLFKPDYTTDILYDIGNKIRHDRNWFELILKDAKLKKRTIEEIVNEHAEYILWEELQNKTDRTYQEHIEYYKLTIKRDPEWYSAVKLKAKENNVSIEEMLECDAIWTYEYNILGMHR